MQDLLNFFASRSGGYGVYIWPAYGISALALGGAVIWCWRGWRTARAKLAALEGRP
jgi:heme exporter protein CcmD